MTARVCPVHGEYAPTGVCRWCEPDDTVEFQYVPIEAHPPSPYWPVKAVTAAELVAEFGESPVASALRDAAGLQRAMNEFWCKLATRALYGVGLRFTASEPVIDAETHAAEESRLLSQHAALRWERVARRWNYKHRNPKGLNEQERAYVWRCWLAQQQRIFDDGEWLRRHIAAGILKRRP